MTTYEDLLVLSDKEELIVKEKPLQGSEGRIKGNRIAIKRNMPTIKKKCALAEELGHHYTTVGDITAQITIEEQKQEYKARLWAYNKLIGLQGILSAYKAGCHTLIEMAEHLEVSEEFLAEALECYRKKYGVCTKINNYVIYFEPNLGVMELL